MQPVRTMVAVLFAAAIALTGKIRRVECREREAGQA